MMKKIIDRRVVNPNIDTPWFKNTLKDLGISLREYEKRLQPRESVGYASRLFRGMKQFSSEDGKLFSRVTGVDFNEVMRRAGGIEPGDAITSRVVPVVGWVDTNRRIRSDGLRGPGKVALPTDMSAGTIALRYQTQGSNLDAMDGVIIYCRPLGPFSAEMLNRWCVIRPKKGLRVVRILKKGSSPRAFNLWDDTDLTPDVEIVEAAAIEWMRF